MLYTWAYDPETLAEQHIYSRLNDAPVLAKLGNTGLNTATGRPQLYPRRAPQAGAVEPFGIYNQFTDGIVHGAIGEYTHSEGLWLVKWIGFDYQEDVLRELVKLALDRLDAADVFYTGMGRIIECTWEYDPVLPDETLEGGGVIVQRGSVYRLRIQPLGAEL